MGVVIADALITDRWTEFQQLARSKGAVPQEGCAAGGGPREHRVRSKFVRFTEAAADTSSHPDADLEAGHGGGGGRGAAGGTFMREFFDAVGSIQVMLRQGRECVHQMDAQLDDVLKATTQERQKAVSEEYARLAETATSYVAASKRGLEDLKQMAEAEDKRNTSLAERRIRQNMQQAMAKKHQQLLLDFQKAQVNLKRALEQRQVREMQMLCPEASPEELAQMIEAGETSSQMVMRRMAGAHAMIFEEVQRIRDKHQDILRLEQSIQDLAQMFQEIAVLVDSQGELLDSIEKNVGDTVQYTGGGLKQLDKALKIQHNTRKWNCCITFSCMVLLLVILGPILLR